ncbi:unnamed protein product, partial [Ectocarpus sp. 8 AP-2014]
PAITSVLPLPLLLPRRLDSAAGAGAAAHRRDDSRVLHANAAADVATPTPPPPCCRSCPPPPPPPPPRAAAASAAGGNARNASERGAEARSALVNAERMVTPRGTGRGRRWCCCCLDDEEGVILFALRGQQPKRWRFVNVTTTLQAFPFLHDELRLHKAPELSCALARVTGSKLR